eukprot:4003111-Heterocapsa_arctica.AAC.1
MAITALIVLNLSSVVSESGGTHHLATTSVISTSRGTAAAAGAGVAPSAPVAGGGVGVVSLPSRCLAIHSKVLLTADSTAFASSPSPPPPDAVMARSASTNNFAQYWARASTSWTRPSSLTILSKCGWR